VRPALLDKLKKKNVHEVPRMEKIVINMGVSASLEKAAVDDAAKDLAMITGQKPSGEPRTQEHREFQVARGTGDRLLRDVAPGYDVRVFDRLVATALHVFVTSAVCRAVHLTDAGTIRWEFRIKRFSRDRIGQD